MKEVKITLKFFEWELIPNYSKPTHRARTFRWLFIDAYWLFNKKK